jgi:hypothetical protein
MKVLVKASVLIMFAQVLYVNGLSAQETATSITTAAPSVGMAWTASLKSEMSNNLEKAKDIGGAATDNQFRLSYKFNETTQAGILLGGIYNLATEGQDQDNIKMINSDVAVVGLVTAPAVLGADKTEVDGRLYLPTSETSEKAAQQYKLRADVRLPYTMGNQRLATLWVSPRLTDYEVFSAKAELLSQAKLAQGKVIAPYVAINHKLVMLDTADITRKEEFMGPEVGVDYLPHKLVKLSLFVAQERNILNPTFKKTAANYSVFNTKETKYLFSAQIKM